MKRGILAVIATGVTMISATTSDKAQELRLSSKIVDLGKVEYAQQVQTQIVYTNNGKSPLMLLDVESECNCVSFKWNKRPIKAGEQDTIMIYFKSKQPGVFYKMANIKTNAGKESFSIKGEVLSKGKKQ
jgi:hypothetical protein